MRQCVQSFVALRSDLTRMSCRGDLKAAAACVAGASGREVLLSQEGADPGAGEGGGQRTENCAGRIHKARMAASGRHPFLTALRYEYSSGPSKPDTSTVKRRLVSGQVSGNVSGDRDHESLTLIRLD